MKLLIHPAFFCRGYSYILIIYCACGFSSFAWFTVLIS